VVSLSVQLRACVISYAVTGRRFMHVCMQVLQDDLLHACMQVLQDDLQ
jgi:hypothetical protein